MSWVMGYGLWVWEMGYGSWIWGTGYGSWVMGYGLGIWAWVLGCRRVVGTEMGMGALQLAPIGVLTGE